MALQQQVAVQAYEYRQGNIVPVILPVSAEYRITLFLNGIPWSIFACSGSDLEQLALGHLSTTGVITSAADIRHIHIDEESRAVHVETSRPEVTGKHDLRVETTATGVGQSLMSIRTGAAGSKRPIPAVRARVILSVMKEFLGLSVLHSQTHGVHSAALYAPDGARLVFFDEIGRHNAIDKVLGFALQQRIDLEQVMVFSTGRLANEIVVKLAASGAPVVVSRAAPTTRSIETARSFNIMMIGGVGPDRFYIYHGSESVQC